MFTFNRHTPPIVSLSALKRPGPQLDLTSSTTSPDSARSTCRWRCSCGKAAEGAHSGEASMNVDPEALSATASTSTMILGCPIV